MTKTRTARTAEERQAIVEAIDLRIQSGGMTHREATRLEGVSDALVHSWRRKLRGPAENGRRTAREPAKASAPASTLAASSARLPVAASHVEAAAALVRAVREGGRAVLQFDGTGWQLRAT